MKTLKQLGEFGLIERFRRNLKTDSSVIKGSGDDCAVLKFDRKSYQLFTCDMLVEGMDFTLKDKPYLIGRKAIAVSISDIASCCGKPRYCVISLGLPAKTELKFVDKLVQGIFEIAKEFAINIVGGDLSRSKKIVIDVSMLGIVEKKYLALRNGSRVGDIIFVTGELGGSILGKHLKFIPRLKEARFLAKDFKINAMTDISDGLFADLSHILKESRVGAVIYEDLIPVSKFASGLSDALNSGEDFELLFTLSPKEAGRLLKKKIINFKPVGEIVNNKYGFKLVDKEGRVKSVLAKGFRHF